MPNYSYEAVDARGSAIRGSLVVINQSEALQRIKEMGLYPTRVRRSLPASLPAPVRRRPLPWFLRLGGGGIKPAALAVFTRQLATLVDVGMPLLRGLRVLQQQERNPALKRVIGEIAITVESGGSMSEALAAHPKVFNRLYVNMVRAGEVGGIVEQVLRRQAEFMEKTEQIKGKIKAAMVYPVAVMLVASAILSLLLVFVIPRFQEVFDGLLNGRQLPAFTLAVFHLSEWLRAHILMALALAVTAVVLGQGLIHTQSGRRWFDRLKLGFPVLGTVGCKVALARLSRTLGTLLTSGVPILQALTIVKETAGNVVVGRMIGQIHDNVKEGGTLADPFKASKLFPDMVGGMVDVGEQTGALPEMLLKIADISDQEVDHSVTALTSLLEPVMIVFLAIIVGGIVIAMFLPLIAIMQGPGIGDADGR